MRIHVEIDDVLIAEAMRVIGHATKRATGRVASSLSVIGSGSDELEVRILAVGAVISCDALG